MMRIGLIGASRIAPNAVIAPAGRRSDVKVTAIAARDPTRAKAYAATHDIAAVAASYAELVTRDDVDVVYCALPAPGHLKTSETALAAGKMLLIEKPFAENADAAHRIVEAAQAARRPALEAFHYRFHSQFGRALDVMRSGALGRIVRAEGVFNVPIAKTPGELRWSPDQGGGATMDLGCYPIHALRTLLGCEPTVKRVEASIEEGVDVSLRAELNFNGIPAVTSSSMARPIEAWVRIEGEDEAMTLHNFIAPQRRGRLVLSASKGETEEAAEGPGTYDAQMEHLVQVWRGEAAPLTGGTDAIANMTVIDACKRPALGGS